MNNDEKKYLTTAFEIAREAGDTIRQNFSLAIIPDWKADGTPLTITDTSINRMVIEKIKKQYPTHMVMGEEESSLVSQSEYIWCCDPIDGTIPFSHGMPNSTFSLAVVKNGLPILGVICEPFSNLMYSAYIGGGAYINNSQKLHVNTSKELKAKIIHVDGLPNSAHIYSELIKQKAFFGTYLSYIYGAKQVASGHFSGSIFFGSNPWDVAAIKVIVEEAGGKCTSLKGREQRYDGKIDGFIASNGLIHDQLIQMLNSN